MSEDAILLLVNVATGVVLLIGGFPMWRGWIKPNHWWGFRTPRTLSDERVWYEANRFTGLGLTVAAVLIGAVSAASYLQPETVTPVTSLILSCVFVTVGLLWSFVKASAYVADLDASPESIGLSATLDEEQVPTEVAADQVQPPRPKVRE